MNQLGPFYLRSSIDPPLKFTRGFAEGGASRKLQLTSGTVRVAQYQAPKARHVPACASGPRSKVVSRSSHGGLI